MGWPILKQVAGFKMHHILNWAITNPSFKQTATKKTGQLVMFVFIIVCELILYTVAMVVQFHAYGDMDFVRFFNAQIQVSCLTMCRYILTQCPPQITINNSTIVLIATTANAPYHKMNAEALA